MFRPTWARNAREGDRVDVVGPRGKIPLDPRADWHLFMGDESAMPAILAMTESLPGDADAVLVIEVPGPADEQDVREPRRRRLDATVPRAVEHRLDRSHGMSHLRGRGVGHEAEPLAPVAQQIGDG